MCSNGPGRTEKCPVCSNDAPMVSFDVLRKGQVCPHVHLQGNRMDSRFFRNYCIPKNGIRCIQ